MNTFRLDGKRALITGTASGIRRSIAFGFAQAGAEVLLLDLQLGSAKLAAEQIHD